MPEATMTVEPQLLTELRTTEQLYSTLYDGQWQTLMVRDGYVRVLACDLAVSTLLVTGTTLLALVTPARYPTPSAVLLYDMLSFGESVDLTSLPFSARYELLATLTMYDPTVGMQVYGTTPVGQHVYRVECTPDHKRIGGCADLRYVGMIARDPQSTSFDAKLCAVVHRDVNSVALFPPVPDEAEKIMSYRNMVRAMIFKMTGKWRDANRSHHCPGQLPFDADDLMQKGLMEIMIALRKYDAGHASKAKDSTFCYRHIWNRLGQIAVKYSKQSRGYGVYLQRDNGGDGETLQSVYEHIVGSTQDHDEEEDLSWFNRCEP